ncbi:hypothetical protein D3C78_1630420 [compost metagenome]
MERDALPSAAGQDLAYEDQRGRIFVTDISFSALLNVLDQQLCDQHAFIDENTNIIIGFRIFERLFQLQERLLRLFHNPQYNRLQYLNL